MTATTFATLSRTLRKGHQAEGHIPRAVRRMFPEVKRLVDATEPVEVTVTPRDCKGAKPLDAGDCAMVRAIERQHKEADGAVIGLTRSYIVTGDTVIRYQTPETVTREVTSFDRRAGFTPGNYHLSAVCPSMRMETAKQLRDKARRRSGKSGKHTAPVVARAKTARVRVLSK